MDFPTAEPERLSALLTAQGVEHQVGRVATGEVFMTKGSRADWVAETLIFGGSGIVPAAVLAIILNIVIPKEQEDLDNEARVNSTAA